MDKCFVMQPFDGGEFDARYDEVIKPAIEAAGLDSYRVDHDPAVAIPIAEIESGIRTSRICLADITLDNANVWFELGYALASDKDVILICGPARIGKFPFDVQHRTIIRYKVYSPRDFVGLGAEITSRLKARIAATDNIQSVTDMVKTEVTEGLSQSEVVTLAAIVQNLNSSEDNVGVYTVKSDLEKAGYTKIAANIALRMLVQKRFIEEGTYEEYNNNDTYTGYSLTGLGWSWVTDNQDKFNLQKPEKKAVRVAGNFADDEIPF